MYRVSYYKNVLESSVEYREFDTWELALAFICDMPNDAFLEMKYYEDSTNNGSTLRGKE